MAEPLTKNEVLAKLETGESFRGIEIGDVDFNGHSFEKTPDFSGAIFKGDADFANATFSDGAMFISTQFLGRTSFWEAIFDGKKGADFRSAKFLCEQEVSFGWSQFLGGANLDGANFGSAQFAAGVSFGGAEFHGDGRANFTNVNFYDKGRVNFNGVVFGGNVWTSFFKTKFSSSQGTSFNNTKFLSSESTSFSKAQFLGPGITSFKNTSFEKNNPVSFNNLIIDPPGSLEFIDVSYLGDARFLYTDLKKINFKNVRFRRTENWLFNRDYLADEDRGKHLNTYIHKNKYNYYSQVEILYRKLRENFEGQLDFHRAGDFHYGELEMRRKTKMLEWQEKTVSKYLPFLKYFNLTQFYKIVSGYGEKWVQALASFVAVWIVFTGLNLFWVEPKAAVTEEQPARMEQWGNDSFHRLGGSVLFSFKVLTLQRWGDEFQLTGTSYIPRIFVAVQHLIGPTIIALMLLAIRRQFRR